jgi:hypothetical protein
MVLYASHEREYARQYQGENHKDDNFPHAVKVCPAIIIKVNVNFLLPRNDHF